MAFKQSIIFPDEIREQLIKDGVDHGRNYNAEVIYVLKRGLEVVDRENAILAERAQ